MNQEPQEQQCMNEFRSTSENNTAKFESKAPSRRTSRDSNNIYAKLRLTPTRQSFITFGRERSNSSKFFISGNEKSINFSFTFPTERKEPRRAEKYLTRPEICTKDKPKFGKLVKLFCHSGDDGAELTL